MPAGQASAEHEPGCNTASSTQTAIKARLRANCQAASKALQRLLTTLAVVCARIGRRLLLDAPLGHTSSSSSSLGHSASSSSGSSGLASGGCDNCSCGGQLQQVALGLLAGGASGAQRAPPLLGVVVIIRLLAAVALCSWQAAREIWRQSCTTQGKAV